MEACSWDEKLKQSPAAIQDWFKHRCGDAECSCRRKGTSWISCNELKEGKKSYVQCFCIGITDDGFMSKKDMMKKFEMEAGQSVENALRIKYRFNSADAACPNNKFLQSGDLTTCDETLTEKVTNLPECKETNECACMTNAG